MEERNVFVLGGSGEVGRELVRELVESNAFDHIVLIGRRPTPLGQTQSDCHTVMQKVVDFENLEQHEDAFEGCRVGFCCLGTTRKKSGKKGQYRVDHDYVVASGKIAKKTGCEEFTVVSSVGANQNSKLHYFKTKGVMESTLAELMFRRLSIFRPGLLLCKRNELRLGERLLKAVLTPIRVLFPSHSGSVSTVTLAKAMVHNSLSSSHNSAPNDKDDMCGTENSMVEIFENRKIHSLTRDINGKLACIK